MNQVSLEEAEGLLGKLLTERIPVQAHFASPSGARVRISGFIESKTTQKGVTISTTGSPERALLVVQPFTSSCDIWYAEKRELSEDEKPIADKYGESSLMFRFRESGEQLDLFFTI